MTQTSPTPPDSPSRPLPRNVKVLGLASLLNDTASEMIYPLLPHFLLTVLLGNRFHLGVIEGVADAVASFVKLWSGGRSDQAGRRKGFIVLGYCVSAEAAPMSWAGMFLSQLASSTTPSSGWARIISSVSSASRLR